MKKILSLVAVALVAQIANAQSSVYSYGFDAAFTADWTLTNQSTPTTTTLWSKASYALPTDAPFGGTTTTLPVGQAGGSNSFALVNYTSTSGTGTISNWLITPVINVKDGDVVSFYTRKGTEGTTDYPDRLELRYSTAASTVIPSGGAADVGSFTNLGVSVNPNLAAGFVYPKVWTQYSFTVSGVGVAEVPARFAFRYFVTNGGPNGANSDIIGVDTFSVNRPVAAVSDALSSKGTVLYPNPVKDVVTIKSANSFATVKVFDAAGKVVTSKSVDTATNSVNLSELPKGVYYMELQNKSGKENVKFIKE